MIIVNQLSEIKLLAKQAMARNINVVKIQAMVRKKLLSKSVKNKVLVKKSNGQI